MDHTVGRLGWLVVVLGLVGIVMGLVFIQQGFAQEALLREAMVEEQITLSGIDGIIDTADKAQEAGDIVREHRHGISPTYGDLLAGERFDPTDPTQLTYAQALNLENYLYLAVASFGLIRVVKAAGLFMILTGVALAAAGYAVAKLAPRAEGDSG